MREALINTLIHADYTDRASILEVKQVSGFVFRNPGMMRVPIAQAFHCRASLRGTLCVYLIRSNRLIRLVLALELLERLLEGEIKARFASNIVQQHKFSELLSNVILRYQNRP